VNYVMILTIFVLNTKDYEQLLVTVWARED
jgi:hypothetical protein